MLRRLLSTAHCTPRTTHCALHTAHCTPHTAHCTLNCVRCTVQCWGAARNRLERLQCRRRELGTLGRMWWCKQWPVVQGSPSGARLRKSGHGGGARQKNHVTALEAARNRFITSGCVTQAWGAATVTDESWQWRLSQLSDTQATESRSWMVARVWNKGWDDREVRGAGLRLWPGRSAVWQGEEHLPHHGERGWKELLNVDYWIFITRNLWENFFHLKFIYD